MADLPELGSFLSPQVWHLPDGGPQGFFVLYDHPTRGRFGQGPFNQGTANRVAQEWRQQIAEGQDYEKRYRAAKQRHGHQKKPKRRTTHQRELRDRLDGFTYPLPSIQNEPQGEEWWGSPFTAKPIPPTREEVTAWQQKAWDASEAYLQAQKKRRRTEQNQRHQKKATKARGRQGDETKAAVQALWDALARDGVPERNRARKVAEQVGISIRHAQRITSPFRTNKKPRH